MSLYHMRNRVHGDFLCSMLMPNDIVEFGIFHDDKQFLETGNVDYSTCRSQENHKETDHVK